MGPYGLWELTPNPPENQSVKFEAFCRVTGGDRNLIMIVFFFVRMVVNGWERTPRTEYVLALFVGTRSQGNPAVIVFDR